MPQIDRQTSNLSWTFKEQHLNKDDPNHIMNKQTKLFSSHNKKYMREYEKLKENREIFWKKMLMSFEAWPIDRRTIQCIESMLIWHRIPHWKFQLFIINGIRENHIFSIALRTDWLVIRLTNRQTKLIIEKLS